MIAPGPRGRERTLLAAVSTEKSCLAKLMAFCDGGSGWVDEGREVDGIYLDFIKALGTVSQSILLGKLRKYRLDEQTVRRAECRKCTVDTAKGRRCLEMFVGRTTKLSYTESQNGRG